MTRGYGNRRSNGRALDITTSMSSVGRRTSTRLGARTEPALCLYPVAMRRVLHAAIVAVLTAALVATGASAGGAVDVVRVTDTSTWNPPSPDPSGIAYDARSRRLLVVDGEVDEQPLFDGANMWLVTVGGDPTRDGLLKVTNEPTSVAFSGERTLWATDDARPRVLRYRWGRDRRWGTDDDRVRFFFTEAFGADDPEGLTFAAGRMYLVDGTGTEVYVVRRGRNGRFDGVRPSGDDRVSHFDVSGFGLSDPEGVTYDPSTGHLFLVSRRDPVLVEITPAGNLVASYDLSTTRLLHPADLAFAPASDGSSSVHVYVVDRGRDNAGDPNENDGRIFELELP